MSELKTLKQNACNWIINGSFLEWCGKGARRKFCRLKEDNFAHTQLNFAEREFSAKLDLIKC